MSKLRRIILTRLYVARANRIFGKLIRRWDGGEMRSQTLRELLEKYHAVTIGRYSYGPILQGGNLPRGTVFGRWCSVGKELIVRRRNHPIERLTQHPYFYNARLGCVPEDTIQKDEDNPLVVGHDVWIGDRVTILSECRQIGNGAVLAAGAIVTKDVPPYAIVGGVPAKVLKYRFDAEIQAKIEMSGWWDLELDQIDLIRPHLLSPVNHDIVDEIVERVVELRREKMKRSE